MKLEQIQIKIDVLTLVAILFILIGVGGLMFYYISYQEDSCVSNPVAYANNNSHDYWWDYVAGINTID